MYMFATIIFLISGFIIWWAMIGYSLSLRVLSKFYTKRKVLKNYSLEPSVTIMVVAHNEEKVILEKLYNITNLEYPNERIEFVVASDNSTDNTNKIVKEFISNNPSFNIRLYEVKLRKGKTNAQNEASKIINTEFIVMTDANSMLDKMAVRELMASFTSENIAYVSGRLSLTNKRNSDVSGAEASYWDSDVAIREIEGRIQTITAGNGALYSCRTSEYIEFDPIESHDSSMPIYYGLQGKRAISCFEAIAYEKAGENISDEFGRKVRMNRLILKHILPDISILNIFKYKWFSYFYFGHRTSRYLLWISHLVVLISNIYLASTSWIYLVILLGQILFYFLAIVKLITKTKNKYLTLIYYYSVTIAAQWVGVYKILTGKTKPFWEKAESTR